METYLFIPEKIKEFFQKATECDYIFKFIKGDYVKFENLNIYVEFYSEFYYKVRDFHAINSSVIFLIEKSKHLNKLKAKENKKYRENILCSANNEINLSQSLEPLDFHQFQISTSKNIIYVETVDELIEEIKNLNYFNKESDIKGNNPKKLTNDSNVNFMESLLQKIPGVSILISNVIVKEFPSISLFVSNLNSDENLLIKTVFTDEKGNKIKLKENIIERIKTVFMSTDSDKKIVE
ncbi:hypothetical protein HERIO_405 [Hepatospora eriocheir]|uniref:Uncharacterized protein n=1 Tax=Hepatospora eriocheir TaxID=1081669 RepID=A0A1X0QDF0_9MICR|nr:hypothetical protein HERIO_405 [Hepatospora eriocheir]